MMLIKNILQLLKRKALWVFPMMTLAAMLFAAKPASAQCSASFTYNVINDSLVSFTNTSTYSGSQVNFYWTFGNGYSFQENPTWGFRTGFNLVCLQLTDSLNMCFDQVCDTIWVGSKDCYADFGYSKNGNQVSFYNNAQSNNGNLSYEWIFGDGTNNSTNPNPVHSYSATGNYNVTLLVHKSGCADTITKQINIAATSSCKAMFQYFPTGKQVQFYDSSSFTGTVSYLWNFGDGATSTSQHPVHNYNSYGPYAVCLTITNSATNCQSQTCDSIYLVNTATCAANFSHYITVNPYEVAFYNQSSPTNGNMYWDFGDGTSSTTRSPSHVYTVAPDSYRVSLTVSTSSCSDTMFKWVYLPAPKYQIQGSIMKGNTWSDDAIVYLIEHDSSAGTLSLADSFNIDSGFYWFQVPPGKYLVKAALTSSDPDYNSYMPTYHDSSLFWSGATEVDATGTNYYSIANVNLVAGTNPGGPGFVGGLISQGANKKTGPGDPLEGVEVMLLRMDDSPVAYTYSDADGKFSFDDIPLGQYQVYTEVFGKTTIPVIVELTEETPEKDDLEIAVGETTITGLFGRNTEFTPLALEIFPNPSNGLINILHSSTQGGDVTIRVLNHTGQEVMRTAEQAAAGQKNVWTLDMTTLPKGLYLIEVMKSANGNTALNVNKVIVR